MDERIMSTLSEYPGYKVVQDLGIIGAFDKNFQMLRNLWQMDESMERVYELLWEKAQKKGANAVLGISMCLGPERALPILMGTAVVLEKED
jgi:uncharacterized protein YbjQ (UPF0145 family)